MAMPNHPRRGPRVSSRPRASTQSPAAEPSRATAAPPPRGPSAVSPPRAPAETRLPLFRYRPLDYSFLVSPGTTELVLIPRIDLTAARAVLVEIRLHQGAIGSGGRFNFHVRGINPSPHDAQDFESANLESVTVTSSTTYPALLVIGGSSLQDLQYPAARLIMAPLGPSSAGQLYLVASGDLVLREAVA